MFVVTEFFSSRSMRNIFHHLLAALCLGNTSLKYNPASNRDHYDDDVDHEVHDEDDSECDDQEPKNGGRGARLRDRANIDKN